jgi:hypothetical protein
MRHLIYPECPQPVYREHPGVLLRASELAAASKEFDYRLAEDTSYYDHAKLRGNFARRLFFAQAAMLLERQRELFFATQDAVTLHTLQAKVAA